MICNLSTSPDFMFCNFDCDYHYIHDCDGYVPKAGPKGRQLEQDSEPGTAQEFKLIMIMFYNYNHVR